MRNSIIRTRYAGLTLLTQRVLPSPTAVNKVSTLLATRFGPAYDATERSRKQILFVNHPLPPGYDEQIVPMGIAEQRQAAVDELMQQSTPVRKIADPLRLTAADMPRVLSRENGEDNAFGVAEIRVLLGSLYLRTSEELAIDERLEGDEGDD